jgi:hypothetical protein
MASKSPAQRALYREREAAKAAGKLPEWYAARNERYSVTFTKATPPPAPTPSRAAATDPEREAWTAAYAVGEIGPVGGSWPEDGRHVPYMVWRLPYNSGPSRPTPPRN